MSYLCLSPALGRGRSSPLFMMLASTHLGCVHRAQYWVRECGIRTHTPTARQISCLSASGTRSRVTRVSYNPPAFPLHEPMLRCSADQRTPSQPAERPVSSPHESSRATSGRTLPKQQPPSSWNAKRAGAEADTQSDFLSNLGEGQDYNINVDHGETMSLLLALFLLV